VTHAEVAAAKIRARTPAAARSSATRTETAGAASDDRVAQPASLRFFVRGSPKSKGSPAIYRRAGTGKPFVRESPAEKSWECAIKVLAQLCARRTGWRCAEGPVAVDLEFLLPSAGKRPRRDGQARAAWLSPTIDIDKAARAALDPLASVLYADDRQVVDLRARKRLAAAGEESGVWVTVWRGNA
jgi:crossover junction endodeoxyribonuclease RusA